MRYLVLALGCYAIGVIAGLSIAFAHIDAVQAECAQDGLVYSPRLHGGLDYCVPVAQ